MRFLQIPLQNATVTRINRISQEPLKSLGLDAMCHDVFTVYEWFECKGAPRRADTGWYIPVQLAFPRMLMMLARMP